jgi:hypothetical protein
MACRGVLVALEKADIDTLRDFESDDERIDHVIDEIEERELGGEAGWAAETDKAWDAIHRCFNNGTLKRGSGDYPFNHIILEGEYLVDNDEYIISLKTPEQVSDIAARIGEITEDELKRRYRMIDPEQYGMPLSDDDEGYTWDWFCGIVDFYRRAAEAGRWVIFTVDQ